MDATFADADPAVPTAAAPDAVRAALDAAHRRKMLQARLVHRGLVLLAGIAISVGLDLLWPQAWPASAAVGSTAGILFALIALEIRFSRQVRQDDVPELLTQELAMLEQCFTILRKQVTVTIRSSESAVLDVVGRLDNVYRLSNTLHQEVVSAVSHSQGLSVDSLRDASRNTEALKTLAETRDQFVTARKENQDRIAAVVARVRELTPLAELITGISRQTNLLAINASIEAARAGPEGAGFKVVAAEVRRLSHQTEEAAHQITQGIASVALAIDTELIEASRLEADQGAERLEELTRTVGEMSDKLGRIVPYLMGLSTDMESGMNTVTSDIVSALGHMQFQDVNRQLLEQVEIALEGLSDHAAALYAVVGRNAPPPPQQLRELMDRWADSYVMHEQRVAHHETLGNPLAAGRGAGATHGGARPASDEGETATLASPRIELF